MIEIAEGKRASESQPAARDPPRPYDGPESAGMTGMLGSRPPTGRESSAKSVVILDESPLLLDSCLIISRAELQSVPICASARI